VRGALQLRAVASAVRGNRDLRLVAAAYALFSAAEYGVWIAMLVYAYGQGGATTAGVVAVAQLVPAALVAAPAAGFADRHGARRVLVAGYVLQALAMAATAAVLLGGGPPLAAYALAAAAASAVTLTRPAQGALLPALAATPDELTAANVVTGWVESASMLAGPALAGALLALAGPGLVFAVFAGSAAVSAALAAGLRAPAALAAGGGWDGAGGVVDGLRTLARERAAALVVTVLAAQFVVIGGLDVLAVVVAVSLLDLGQAAAGYLTAAFGAGGLAAGLVTARLIGRSRLAPFLLTAMAGWGGALIVLGGALTAPAAFLLMAAAGLFRSLLDVAGRTLLQRTAPADAVARLFGVLESLTMIGLAAGSLLAPLLVGLGGGRAAVVGVGLVLPLLALALAGPLRRLDAAATVPAVEMALLRCLPMAAPLPAPELEALAHSLRPVELPAGAFAEVEGERGDRFSVVARGEVEVLQQGRLLRLLGRGDGFGEIALLRDTPRTASVRARGDVLLYTLAKEDFLRALTGSARARAAAEAVAVERLAHRA
jgi:MFS family permease